MALGVPGYPWQMRAPCASDRSVGFQRLAGNHASTTTLKAKARSERFPLRRDSNAGVPERDALCGATGPITPAEAREREHARSGALDNIHLINSSIGTDVLRRIRRCPRAGAYADLHHEKLFEPLERDRPLVAGPIAHLRLP